MDNMLRRFDERNAADLRVAMDEIKWWNSMVVRGVVSPAHAEGYIMAENNIIATKRFVLGMS